MKFEYMVVLISIWWDSKMLEDMLGSYGRDGWDLKAIHDGRMIFSRPVPSKIPWLAL